MQKNVALLFLSLAYAIVLGHNIVPHHHHENKEVTEHHSGEHHHHHNHSDEEGKPSDKSDIINHIFSEFPHSSENFTNNSRTDVAKLFIDCLSILPDNFSTDEFFIPPLLHFSSELCSIPLQALTYSVGLRAPPAL